MSSLSTLPKGDSAWLLRKSIQRIMQQVSVLETNIGSSTTGNSANTQVIFNDAGTLRGDAGLTYNKATDTLSTGSATITGDLTVDTNTLKVDSANNRVGIVNASPLFPLDVSGSGVTNSPIRLISASGTNVRFDTGRSYTVNRNWIVGCDEVAEGVFTIIPSTTLGGSTFTNPVYRVSYDGIHTFLDGAGGTRMTLNSTGLGVGVSPATKLDVRGTINGNQAIFTGTVNRGLVISTRSDGLADDRTVILNAQHSTGAQGQLVLQTVGTDRLLIDSSGNVGVGVTPSAWGSGYTAIQNRQTSWFATSARDANFSANVYVDAVGYKYIATAQSSLYTQYQGAHSWYTAPSGTAGNAITFTQAMTLDASGNFLLNTSTANSSLIQGFNVYFNGGSTQSFIGHITGTSSGAYYTGYSYNGSLIGSITQNGTTGVLFNTSSDYRLKEAVQPLTGGLARINALKPSIYKWKSDGSSGEGFIAHELAEVVPLAVTGEKDAVNEDGSIKPQGVDLSRVVPILVAAIKELSSEVNALKNA